MARASRSWRLTGTMLSLGRDHHRGGHVDLADPAVRGELAGTLDGRDGGAEAGPPQLGARLPGRGRVLDRAHEGQAEEFGAHRLQERVPPDGGGRRRQSQGGQPLRRRAQDVAGGGAQHQAGQQATGAAGTAAGRPCRPWSSPRRRTGRGRGTCASAAMSSAQSSSRNRGPTLMPSPWPRRSMAITRKCRESGAKAAPQLSSAVKVTPWMSMRCRCAAGACALPHPRDAAAGQLHQAGTRSRGLPGYLAHGLTLLRCQSAGARPTIHPASGPCVRMRAARQGPKGPDTL